MGREVVCVRPDVSVESIAAILLQRNVGGLPVVDGATRPIGIVSKSDVVRAYSQGRFHNELDTFDVTVPRRSPARTARDIMTPIGLTLREREPVSRAAELFSHQHVHRAPVVSGEGRLVGILTSFDLLRALVTPRAELED